MSISHAPEPVVRRPVAAKHVGVPVSTMAQWAYHGTGPPYYRIGRHAMYRLSEVDAWIDSHAVEPRPAA